MDDDFEKIGIGQQIQADVLAIIEAFDAEADCIELDFNAGRHLDYDFWQRAIQRANQTHTDIGFVTIVDEDPLYEHTVVCLYRASLDISFKSRHMLDKAWALLNQNRKAVYAEIISSGIHYEIDLLTGVVGFVQK